MFGLPLPRSRVCVDMWTQQLITLMLVALAVVGGCKPAEPHGPKRRIEEAGGFSFVPPPWTAHKVEGNDFAVYLSSNDPPSALEFRRDLSVPDKADAVQFLVQRAEKVYTDSGLIEAGDFTTDSGLRGKRIVLENRTEREGKPTMIRQIIYLFPNGGDTHTFWGSAPADAGDKFDPIFDAVAKSYRVEKIE